MKQTLPSDLPIARLDAQDLEIALPIREYLEQNGVAVVIGRKPAVRQEYHIIVGDTDFVKQSLEPTTGSHPKTFLVLFLGYRQTVPEWLLKKELKIAAIAGTALSARDVPKIFAHFFTGEDSVLYVDTSERPMVEVKPVGEDSGIERKEDSKRESKKKKIPGKKLLFFGATFFLAPLVWYFVSLAMIAGLQWYALTNATRAETSRLAWASRLTRYWIGQGSAILRIAGTPIAWMGAGDVIRGQERVLAIALDVVRAQERGSTVLAESRQLGAALLGGEDATVVPIRMDRTRLALEGVAEVLGLVSAQLRLLRESRTFPFGFPSVGELVRRAQSEVSRVLSWTGSVRSLLALYRAMGGFDRKKTYVVLLQNSAELRPTGGFIGSVAVVSVEEGVVETPVVQDVYALDGQLKGHVDPPGPVKELLQQEHWYLRDSNWDPDFAVSGEKAAWFYEKETGQTVDGVIGVTTNLLTDLLAVTGPIDLPDYNDRITKDNFFGKSLFYTKADFFPGSTQKKDFLGSLMAAIVTRLASARETDAAGVLRVMLAALASGDLQAWFADPAPQTIARQAGWSGSIAPIALVEANLGMNKVNAFISRRINARVDIDEAGTMDGTIAITYQNASEGDAALSGGGTYLGYLRAYLPPDALVASMTVDGEEMSAKTKDGAIPYRDPDEIVGGSMIVSLAFTVPPKATRTVMLTYRRGWLLPFTDRDATLAVTVRKQPGVAATPLDLAIGYPAGWEVVEGGAPSRLANMAEVRYNTVLDTTKVFTIRFRK